MELKLASAKVFLVSLKTNLLYAQFNLKAKMSASSNIDIGDQVNILNKWK